MFCPQCKAKFLLETDSLYWWSMYLLQVLTMDSRNVKHQGNGSNQSCQVARINENFKKQNVRSIQSPSWLFERFRVWFRVLIIKMIWKRKWIRLHLALREKLKTASDSKQIQILTLVPECTVQNILTSLNTLLQLHMKSKK